ncbi:protein-tyrosine phosphatase family protein [Microlunatus soli]|uniref:Uncharacterized protein n=1 Tax=Microlunatus soli TaxID=630515 RepID=A0A1H2AE23_9ACTN|nr:hypothetical protein [Microlunatus soli]SDT44245.1 hypothetical protein SAMN04489812_5867 [Microlunatus soli]
MEVTDVPVPRWLRSADLTGHLSAGDAVGWVRQLYCAEAIETPDQETLVAQFADWNRPVPA